MAVEMLNFALELRQFLLKKRGHWCDITAFHYFATFIYNIKQQVLKLLYVDFLIILENAFKTYL